MICEATMDPLTQDQLLGKVGAKYKLVGLIQRRMRELVAGMPPLVEAPPQDLWGIVVREILEGKIELATGGEAEKMRRDLAARELEELPAGSADKKPAEAAKAAEEKKA